MNLQQQQSGKNTNRTILLLLTMSSHFLNPFMGSAINVALKQIGLDFSMSAVGLSWISMSYLLSAAVFLVPFGKVGDMIGRRQIFFYGTILFAITSILCGFAKDAQLLIIFRLLQGISSAMMISTNMALIIAAYPPQDRGKVIGLNVTAVYVGSSIAPVIGGLLTDTLGWRSIFIIIGIAAIIIAFLIGTKIQKEEVKPEKEKFDIKGSLVYMFSISMLMYGFSKLPSLHAIILTILGILGFVLFIKMQLKTKNPVLNVKLFSQNRVFALSNFSAFINYAATFAISFMLSLYLQYAKGMEAREAGLILIAQPTLMAIVASFSGRLSDKKNPRHLAALGMGISMLGLFILTFINQDTTILYIIFGLIVLGFGFGLFSAPNTNVVMSSVDNKIYGIASATLATMRSTGMMFSMAIAALTMHIFLGDAKINIQNVPYFITSTKVVFIIFTILCFIGVFFSLAKKKMPQHPQS